jgi:hypothetical protein
MEPAPRDPTATAILPELDKRTSWRVSRQTPPSIDQGGAANYSHTPWRRPMVARVFRRRADADLHRGE